jgi:hypothetical protein
LLNAQQIAGWAAFRQECGPVGQRRIDGSFEFLAQHIRAAASATPISAEELPFHLPWTRLAEPEDPEMTDDDFVIPYRDDDW